jgi:hypothetical protein
MTPFLHGLAHSWPDRGQSDRETDSVSEFDGGADGGGDEKVRTVAGGVHQVRV